MMMRTQIYLPKSLKHQAESLARERGISLAEVLRSAVKEMLHASTKPRENPLEYMAKLKIKGGPKDLSKNYKKYIYGE